MMEADMTAGGGMISGNEDSAEPRVETRVSPVRVNLSPRTTPTEPKESESTSSALEA
jgi:hypothetical protein